MARQPGPAEPGDRFSYAPAEDMGEPLLFKGDDFIHTDVEPVL